MLPNILILNISEKAGLNGCSFDYSKTVSSKNVCEASLLKKIYEGQSQSKYPQVVDSTS